MEASQVGQRVRIARESLPYRMSQSDLARKLKVLQAVVSNWERGKHNPKPAMFQQLAEILEVNYQWLETGVGPMRDNQESNAQIIENPTVLAGFNSSVALPVYRGILAAGSWDDECTFDADGSQEIPVFFLKGGAAHASEHVIARIVGSSMSPRIMSAESCVLYLDPAPRPNTIVLVKAPDTKTYLKALRQTANGWRLESINKSGITIDNLNGYELIGHVIAILGGDDREGPNIEWKGGRPIKV